MKTKNKYGDMHKDGDSKDFQSMEGWTIKEVGMTDYYEASWGKGNVEGGLTFIIEKDGVKKKVILGYTELGAWVESEETLSE